MGYNAQILADVENGQEVVELLKDSKADAVLTDIRMPDMDGLELCRYIHENQFFRHNGYN